MAQRLLSVALFLSALTIVVTVRAADAPPGFTSLFNGRDLAGWRGRPHLDPREDATGTPEERAARQDGWNRDMASHWAVQNGVIVSDGQGVFLTTDRDYGDVELLIEWMLPVPCADSGIYLRGNPQVNSARSMAPGPAGGILRATTSRTSTVSPAPGHGRATPCAARENRSA
jgi:hypothetical protein